MFKFLVSLVLSVMALSAGAQTHSSITCLYRAVPDYGPVQNVTMRFTQDRYGRPMAGLIRVEDQRGLLQEVRIPGRDIASMIVHRNTGTELSTNIHVRSHDVDLVLNYSGNDFAFDAGQWLRRDYLSLNDLAMAYEDMLHANLIQHRVNQFGNVLVQMTGSVRWYGSLRKFASSKFVCTEQL